MAENKSKSNNSTKTTDAQKTSPTDDAKRLPEYAFGDIAPVGDRWFALRFKCTAPHPDASPEAERSRTAVRDALLAVRREFFETGSGAEWLGAQARLVEVEADLARAIEDEATAKSRWSASLSSRVPKDVVVENENEFNAARTRTGNARMAVDTLREVVESAEIKARENLARLVAEELDRQRTATLTRVREAEAAMSAALAGPLDAYEAAQLQWAGLNPILTNRKVAERYADLAALDAKLCPGGEKLPTPEPVPEPATV